MNRLLLYKSSAGAGKTYSLVREYLCIALAQPGNYRHILAVTFTNKAAEEMKTRVIGTLSGLAEGREPALKEDLRNALGLKDIPAAAQTVLHNILHDYTSFSVETIDSFFLKIIRAFAKEMHLPLRHEIETDNKKITEQIAGELLNDAGKNEELTRWLENMLAFRISEDKGWSIEKDIIKIAQELFNEKVYDSLRKNITIDENFPRDLAKIKFTFSSRMKELAASALRLIRDNKLSPANFKRGTASWFEKIMEGEFNPGNTILKIQSESDNWHSKTSPRKEEILAITAPLNAILSETLSYYNDHYKEFVSASEALRMIHVYGIIRHLFEKMKKYRDENKSIFISDTTRLLRGLVSGDDTPYIFEKTGNRYFYFLLDEFQDTSVFQWENILPLIKNSLGSGYASLIVGDVKQSIYRWRGGNATLLLSGAGEDLRAFREIMKEEMLGKNYRSLRQIVDFNNGFFPQAATIIKEHLGLKKNILLDTAYDHAGMKQETVRLDGEGFVKISFTGKEEDAEEKVHWKEAALEGMLGIIRNIEKDNFSLRDIAILTRKNTEGNEVADFLFANGYKKIITAESLLLHNSINVRFLLSAFRFLGSTGEDPVALAELLYLYNELNGGIIKDSSLHSIFSGSTQEDIMKKLLPYSFIAHIPLLRRIPAYDLSEYLIQIFRLNKNPDAYLQRFQDVILEVSSSRSSDIRYFTDWWKEHSGNYSVITPEGENAIRIMTIHKAKGLQFPVVIIPFCEWKLGPDNKDILWTSSGIAPFSKVPCLPVACSENLKDSFFREDYLEECAHSYVDNLNLLYVAFTRPEERLYVFSKHPAGKDKLNTTGDLLFRALKANPAEAGTEEKHTAGKRNPAPSIPMKEYLSTHWQSRLSVSPQSRERLDIFNREKQERINYGILVHEILRNIITKDDLPSALDRLLYEGIIGTPERAELEIKIMELLSTELPAEWFSGKWKTVTEREILLPGGEMIRPDRVMINGEKAVVVDYKTGAPKAADRDQVNRYASALLDLGFSETGKYIFYISQPAGCRIIPVE